MARSRNIKPGYFKNELLAECSPLARLLFAGLWCLADRAGRLEDRPKRIRAEILPYDDGSVDGMLAELQSAGFILRYQVEGKGLIQVVNFVRHQNPHCKEPASAIPAPGEHGASRVQEQFIHSTCTADSLNPNPDSGLLMPETIARPVSTGESDSAGFELFWQRYPRKVAKPAALKAWNKLKPVGALLDALTKGLERQAASSNWQKNDGAFIPHPATWLNGRRWEDEVNEHAGTAGFNGALNDQDYAKGITDDGRF